MSIGSSEIQLPEHLSSIPTNDQYIEAIRKAPTQKFLMLIRKKASPAQQPAPEASEVSRIGQFGAGSLEDPLPKPKDSSLKKEEAPLPPSKVEEEMSKFYTKMQRYT